MGGFGTGGFGTGGFGGSGVSSLASLAPDVQNRLQDPNGIFWNLDYEIYPALEEAISELLMIIGRPMNAINVSFQLVPNTVWQTIPSSILFLTDVWATGQLKKTTLRGLDYTQASWGSSWESDRAALPQRWAPVGIGQFIIHPAVLQPIQVQLTGVAPPFTDPWPPAGTDTSPFRNEWDQALQMYAAFYARQKEGGAEFQEGITLYKQFLDIGQRLSTVEDRRDDLAFSRAFGVPTAPSQVGKR